MKMKLLGLVLAGLMVIAGSAQAALLSLTPGGTANAIPGSFYTGAFPAIPGIVTGTPIQEFGAGDVGGLSLAGPATLKFEFLGKDAGFTNTFSVTGTGTLFSTASAAVGDAANVAFGSSGLIPFFFSTSGGGTPATANNGGPITSPLSIAFADLGGDTFLALFNDGGGRPTDDKDFNDMIVRVSVSAVPLPAAAWLLISAVLGLVSFSRIRRKGPQTA